MSKVAPQIQQLIEAFQADTAAFAQALNEAERKLALQGISKAVQQAMNTPQDKDTKKCITL